MTLRQLPLSADQVLATRRADQDGSVYLLSGTLKGMGATPDVEFRWATLSFSGALGEFDAYILKPNTVVRAHEYAPGGGATFPAINVPVRNLPFAGSESMLSLIDDGNYSWENSEASLLVGFLKPGQQAEDLAAADFTYLVSGGVFGPPNNVEMDGFTAVVYMRGVRRAQSFKQPLMPDVTEARGASATYPPTRFIAFDQKDMGIPLPLVIGKPATWYRLPTIQTGVRGFTVSGYNAGDRRIQFRVITDGYDRLQASGSRTITGNPGPEFMIHYRTPTYHALLASGINYNEETGIVTMTLNSGLAATVPRGAFIQEHLLDGVGATQRQYAWVLAGHRPGLPLIGSGAYPEAFGWLLSDGSIRIAEPSLWPLSTALVPGIDEVGPLGNPRGLSLVGFGPGALANPVVPCYFDPLSGKATVTQQPAFDQELRLDAKPNYPSGGTGTNNANARDGNDDTGVSLPVSTVITLTFNSESSGDFADGDTTASTLHVIAYGDILVTNGNGTTTFATISTGGALQRQLRFVQASPRDFNETMRFVGQGGSGGVLFEAWWEHDLVTTKSSTRTADVVINSAASGVVGEVLQYADLVFRVPNNSNGFAGSVLLDGGGSVVVGGAVAPFRELEAVSGVSGVIPYPTSAMLAIQSYFLGVFEGASGMVNSGVYRIAHELFKAADVRWNFVLQNPVSSWAEVEQQLALQAQSHFYYGPTGHEIVYKEGLDLASSGVVQEFYLPGTPRCNTVRASGPLLERMLTSEVINTAAARWNLDAIEGGQYRNQTEVQDADSVTLFGAKRDPQAQGGAYEFWAHSPWDGHPTFDAAACVSGMLDFYAGLASQARTRFRFDTAWIAHGLDRGSPVRVIYAVAPNVFRNVVAEVEEIAVNPINGDRFTLRCRALDVPNIGLPILTWEELFTDESQLWTDHIDTGETWKQNWSL